MVVFSSNHYQLGSTIVKSKAYLNDSSKNEYIVLTKSQKAIKEIDSMYEESDTIGNTSEGNIDNQNICAVSLTDSQLSTIRDKEKVISVEKDDIISANGKRIKNREFNHCVQRDKKNGMEWNQKMVKAEKNASKPSGRKVKIGIIDSGVDEYNDIELVEYEVYTSTSKKNGFKKYKTIQKRTINVDSNTYVKVRAVKHVYDTDWNGKFSEVI